MQNINCSWPQVAFSLQTSQAGTVASDWRSVIGIFVIVVATLFVLVFFARRKPNSIDTSSVALKFPEWDTADPVSSLAKMFAATVNYGESTVKWYDGARKSKRNGSQVLRALAIILASTGALFPLLVVFGQSQPWLSWLSNTQWGYIAFATAGACLAADKFYGFSSSWIRDTKTQLAIQGTLVQLRYEWTALGARIQNNTPSNDQIELMLNKLKDFAIFVNGQIEQETDAWILEFQSGMADLTTAIKSRADAAKPGSLQVEVTNAREFDGGVKVWLDHQDMRQIEGTQCLFTNVVPGLHEILIRGTKDNAIFEASGVARVTPDSQAIIKLPFPTS